MNCNTCEPLLSVYIEEVEPGRRSLGDGGRERAAIEAHLRTCAACRVLAEDLTAIRLAARSLEPLVPPARVWHRIAAAAEAEPRASWLQSGWLNWRPLTAVAMTALIAASLWRVGTLLGPIAEPHSVPDSTVASAEPTSVGLGPESDYTMAIAQLERVANADRNVLDQDTAGVLTAGLTVIDGAISESRAALQAEPQSESAQESLFTALRRKVALLQETVALINETRNGDQDGSARILPEINR